LQYEAQTGRKTISYKGEKKELRMGGKGSNGGGQGSGKGRDLKGYATI